MTLKKIAEKYNLEALMLFGSRAQDMPLHQESDFDIAYIAKKPLDLMDEARLITDLMQYFKSEKIDLLNLKNASPLLRYNVFKNYKTIYKKENFSLAPLEAYAFKQHIELRPLYQIRSEYLRRKYSKNHDSN